MAAKDKLIKGICDKLDAQKINPNGVRDVLANSDELAFLNAIHAIIISPIHSHEWNVNQRETFFQFLRMCGAHMKPNGLDLIASAIATGIAGSYMFDWKTEEREAYIAFLSACSRRFQEFHMIGLLRAIVKVD